MTAPRTSGLPQNLVVMPVRVGRYYRIVTVKWIRRVFIGFPVVVPIRPVDQITVLVFLIWFQIERYGIALRFLFLHRRGMLVPVVKIPYEVNVLYPLGNAVR